MNSSTTTLVNTRKFLFPREKVFAAFANQEQLVRWWGPEGFTNTITEFEFRPGGNWKILMHAPDGASYPNESRFTEIHEPAKIVFEHDGPVHHYHMTMRYDEAGESSCRLTWEMTFDSEEHLSAIKDFIWNANEQNFDRLNSVLHTQP